MLSLVIVTSLSGCTETQAPVFRAEPGLSTAEALQVAHELLYDPSRRAGLFPRASTDRSASFAPTPTTVSHPRLGGLVTRRRRPHKRPPLRIPAPLKAADDSIPLTSNGPGEPPTTTLDDLPPRGPTPAIVEVIVNARSAGESVVLLSPNDVFVPIELLRKAGIVASLPTEKGPDNIERVSLARLKDHLIWRLDEDAIALVIRANPELFSESFVSLAPARPTDIIHTRDASAFLNYGLRAHSQGGLGASAELGARFGDTLITTSADLAETRGLVRGLSSIVIDDARRMHRWTVGDAFANTESPLGGATFLAGLTFAKAWELDPYQSRRPTLSFNGTVATPSTLEVWVDGSFVRKVELSPGAFRLSDLPAPTLAGDATFRIRDALGFTQTFTQPYFIGAGTLAAGVHDYAASIGFARRNFGVESFDYGAPVALARHRFGLTNALTAGWTAEGALMTGDVSGSLQLALDLPIGRLDLGGAASVRDGKAGGAWSASFEHTSRGFAAALFAIGKTHAFGTHNGDETANPTVLEVGGRASISGRSWRFGLDGRFEQMRAGIERLRASGQLHVTPVRGLDLGIRGGWSQTSDDQSGYEVVALVNLAPGLWSANASHSFDGDQHLTQLAANLPIRNEHGVGVQAQATIGELLRLRATPHARTPWGDLHTELTWDGYDFAGGADIAGGLVFVEGAGLHVTRPVRSSFAIIDVPKEVDLLVFRDNREIGRTSNGSLVVPDLLPHYGNRLAVDVGDLGLDYEVGELEKVIAPPMRGGARVTFALIRTAYVRGRLTRDGVPPSFGTLVVVSGRRERRSPLGKDAEFELQGLTPGVWFGRVEHRDGICRVRIEVGRVAQPILDLGVLECRPVTGPNPFSPLALFDQNGVTRAFTQPISIQGATR